MTFAREKRQRVCPHRIVQGLSSSGHSFIVVAAPEGLQLELFLHAIDNELPIPVGSFTDKQFAVSDEDVEDDPTPHGSLASRYEELRKESPGKDEMGQLHGIQDNSPHGSRTRQRDVANHARSVWQLGLDP